MAQRVCGGVVGVVSNDRQTAKGSALPALAPADCTRDWFCSLLFAHVRSCDSCMFMSLTSFRLFLQRRYFALPCARWPPQTATLLHVATTPTTAPRHDFFPLLRVWAPCIGLAYARWVPVALLSQSPRHLHKWMCSLGEVPLIVNSVTRVHGFVAACHIR